MKGLLIDENLPVPNALPAMLPIVHSTLHGVQPSDTFLWRHAIANDPAIVSKDADFSERIQLTGPPLRVVHLRVGNMRRSAFLNWPNRQWPEIEKALPEHKLINVYRDHMDLIA